MNAESNKALLKRYYEEVWGKGDHGVEAALVAPDLVDHMPMPGQPQGIEGHRQTLDMIVGAFPDRKFSYHDFIAEGDKVVGHWTMAATHAGALMGLPASGKPVKMSGIDITRWRNGKLVEMWHIEDIMTMMQQIGAIPGS
jgi:steroid delta-isomerase-like uncharacterized protein